MLPTLNGDMARWASNARHTQQVKTSINRLSGELATKRHADMPRALGADRAMHFQLSASHAVLESYQSNARNIGLQLQLAQTGVNTITNSVQALSEGLLHNPEMMSEMDVGLAIHEGGSSFKTIIDNLNLRAGGRTIFAGVRTDTPPLPSADAILSDLRATFDFNGSPSDILAEVETYFESPTGALQAIHYKGGDAGAETVPISETRKGGLTTTALDKAFTSALAGAALAAIAGDGSLADSHSKQVEMLGLARDKLLDRSPLAELEARIGSKQQRTDEAMAANAARLTSVATQLNNLEQPDEYDTVNRLLEAQSQLEMHFTVTNRLAQLSFMNFMR